MAKIQVTTADTNSFLNAARTVFRDSDGIPYILSLDETNDNIEVYKGILYESLVSDSNSLLYSGSMTAVGQSFTGNGSKLIQVSFYIAKNGTPTGNIIIKLYAHTGTFGTSSEPTGLVLATSNSVDISTLSTSSSYVNFIFDTPYNVVDSTNYVIVIEYSGGDGSNYLKVAHKGVTSSCDGNYCTYALTWTTYSTIDARFILYTSFPESFVIIDSETGETDPVAISGAIDSGNVIHISWLDNKGKASPLRYSTIDLTAGTPTFTTPVNIVLDIGETPTTTSLYTAIAIDSNDVPHIVYNEYPKIGGVTTYVAMYVNKVGGSWNTVVNVEYTQNIDCSDLDISIDLDNVPVISFDRDETNFCALIGNLNNATSFDLKTLASSIFTIGTSIAIDSEGNHWVAYTYDAGYIIMKKHNYSDNWITWQLDINNSNVGIHPSLVIVGTDIYVFYEDNANDIVYDVYDGSSWDGETQLEDGTFNSVRAKWGFWVDNDSAGSLIICEPLDDLTNLYIGQSTATLRLAQEFTLHRVNAINNVILRLLKVGTPTDNLLITIRSTLDGSILGSTATIAGADINTTITNTICTIDTSNLSIGTYYVQIQRSGAIDGSNYYCVGIDDSSPKISNGQWIHNSSTWSKNITRAFNFLIKLSAIELDYAFADEETSPDIWWNTLSLAVDWTTKNLKYHNGSIWVTKPLKAYIASAWTTKSIKTIV